MPGAFRSTGEPLNELAWLLLFLPKLGRGSLLKPDLPGRGQWGGTLLGM